MSNFSLCYSKEKALPVFVSGESGERFNVDADFKTVLKIIKLFEDGQALQRHKTALALKWFYRDGGPGGLSEALDLLYEFIKEPDRSDGVLPKRGRGAEKQFCYEFDAREIYASFLAEYGVDLLEAGFLHWFKFKIMLNNLSEDSAFAKKIRLRFIDLKDYKGEAYLKMSRAKRAAQLPVKYTAEEQRAIKEVLDKVK